MYHQTEAYSKLYGKVGVCTIENSLARGTYSTYRSSSLRCIQYIVPTVYICSSMSMAEVNQTWEKIDHKLDIIHPYSTQINSTVHKHAHKHSREKVNFVESFILKILHELFFI